jgi:hypothetical protein
MAMGYWKRAMKSTVGLVVVSTSRSRAGGWVSPRRCDRSVLALWTIPHGLSSRFYARRMSVFGGLGPLLQVDQTTFYQQDTGFVDSQGRSIVVHRGLDARHPGQFEQQAFIADPNGPFKGPYRLAPELPGCSLNTGEEREIQPTATSPNGYGHCSM